VSSVDCGDSVNFVLIRFTFEKKAKDHKYIFSELFVSNPWANRNICF